MVSIPAKEVRWIQRVAIIAISSRFTLAWHGYPDTVGGVLRVAHFRELNGTIFVLLVKSFFLTSRHPDALFGIVRVAEAIHRLRTVLSGATKDRVTVVVHCGALLRHPDAIVGFVRVEANPVILERSGGATAENRIPVLVISCLSASWGPHAVFRVFCEAELLELETLCPVTAISQDRVAVLVVPRLAASRHPDAGFWVIGEALHRHAMSSGLVILSEDRVSVLVVSGLATGRYPDAIARVISVAHLLVLRGAIDCVLSDHRIAIFVDCGAGVGGRHPDAIVWIVRVEASLLHVAGHALCIGTSST